MIVLGVFLHRVAEVAFPKRNHLRQAFRLDRANESLGARVQIGASRGEADRTDAWARQRDFKRLREQRIPIADQVAAPHEEAPVGVREISSELGHPLVIG